MSNPPYSQAVSPLNPSFINFPLSSFLASSATAPTASSGYCLYQKSGNMVTVQFKIVYATLGSGNYRLSLPVPISTIYTKPQGEFNIRYVTAGGQVHSGHFYELDTNTVALVASTTFHGVPANYTSASPDTLTIGDILTGEISYVTP